MEYNDCHVVQTLADLLCNYWLPVLMLSQGTAEVQSYHELKIVLHQLHVNKWLDLFADSQKALAKSKQVYLYMYKQRS